jgi:hypothetical protein
MAIHQSAAIRRAALSRAVAGALAAAAALPAFAGPTLANAERKCDDRATLLTQLQVGCSEAVREQRLIGDDVPLELLASRAGSWTIYAGITKVHRGYVPLESPICATPGEIAARLISEGLSAEPRIGLSGPGHGDVEPAAVGFVQEWLDAGFAAVVRGNRDQACIVGVAKG